MKRSTSAGRLERRRQVANFALRGWTQAAIARHMNIPPATISRDLAQMRESWREFPVHDFHKIRLEQLQKIDLVETEAWAAWQRSQEPLRSASLSHGKTGEQSRSSLKHQIGDHRFLREISHCIAQRCRLIGLSPVEPPPPEVVDNPLAPEKYGKAFADFLASRLYFGDPPYTQVTGLTAEETAAIVARSKVDPFGHLYDELRGNRYPRPPRPTVTTIGGNHESERAGTNDSNDNSQP